MNWSQEKNEKSGFLKLSEKNNFSFTLFKVFLS